MIRRGIEKVAPPKPGIRDREFTEEASEARLHPQSLETEGISFASKGHHLRQESEPFKTTDPN